MSRSQNNIEEILSSLNNVQRAEARPFMYTRVMARLREDDVKSFSGRVVAFIARPLVAFACLTAVIATNLLFVINSEKAENETVVTATVSSADEFLQNENLVLAVNNLEASE